MDSSDIKNLEAEAGVIATLIHHPDYFFFADDLDSHMFTDMGNAMLFFAIKKVIEAGGTTIDALSISNALRLTKASRDYAETTLTVDVINDIIETGRLIARDTEQDYMVLVNGVKDAAFRRDMFDRLEACQRMCFSSDENDIQEKVYSTLDDVMLKYTDAEQVPAIGKVADQLWQEIQEHQKGFSGYPFKFQSLNRYVTLERGELVIICAPLKTGKSAILLNEAVDLLNQGLRVLYLDSELSSRLFMIRLLSHLTGIEFWKIRTGSYSEEELERIQVALLWIKDQGFIHKYMPQFSQEAIYTVVKKAMHTTGVDVLIVDYFKSSSTSSEAFSTYKELGDLVDLVKNKLCGDLDIAGLGAAQLTSTGKIADSARIGRNASTIIALQNKSADEIAMDGEECGTKKLVVQFNRNGAQMRDDEYIDLRFIGNTITYEEATQHCAHDEPF